ncbi:hypothetical protein NSA19_00995 [Actinomyces bowdenii]|uniref:hypothetical protein n=1 Tax=Actinomyces bowdenii TaxID=131109 RepID=UPI00214AF1AC|nr:hypothetical protein [Actinomyces bowdenii]MCR2051453.1 hypothetical protein [Actinomyces bowdenii]
MPTNHWKGLTLPTAGDDLLGSWKALADTANVIVTAQSVRAAREMLTRATVQGFILDSAHPVYFNILGNLYCADGQKAPDQTWVLHAMSEPDHWEGTYGAVWSNTLTNGQFTGVIRCGMTARPYDRWATISAGFYGNALSGHVDLCVSAHGKMRLSRFDAGDAQSVTLTCQCRIPAGATPDIQLGVRGGGPSGGRVSLTADRRFNYLEVLASPISMA